MSLGAPEGRLLLRKYDSPWLNRDELRYSPTFNYSRVMRYLVLVDEVFGALERRDVSLSRNRLILEVISLIPCRQGPGKCRALGYALSGGIPILILFLTIISTISARIAETRNKLSAIAVKAPTFFIAITLRWFCLSLAIANAVGMILLCCLQFSNYLETCYCNASVLGRGADSFVIISPEGSMLQILVSRISAIGLAGVIMAIFVFSFRGMTVIPEDIVKSTTQVSGD